MAPPRRDYKLPSAYAADIERLGRRKRALDALDRLATRRLAKQADIRSQISELDRERARLRTELARHTGVRIVNDGR